MDDRFRRLPPRIEPLYETHDVSGPPPLPEVRETIGLTPGGEVADFERFATALARQPEPHGTGRRVLVVLLGALAVGMAVMAAAIRFG